MKLIVVILICLIKICNSANILCIIPTASYSHQIPYRPIWKELHARGHHLTVLTTDPMNDPNLTNITEIDLHFTYDIFNKHNFTTILVRADKGLLEMGPLFEKMMDEGLDVFFNLPEVIDLITNPKHKFDLLMMEMNIPYLLAFSWRFNCPWISLNSLDAHIALHYLVGNSIHPAIYPDMNLKFTDLDNLSFFERLFSFGYTIMYSIYYDVYFFNEQSQRMKQYFGEDLPHLRLINKEISAMFINTNPIFTNVRPVVPNTIFIGDGIHIVPPKPLPNDIQGFLDKADNGVIYFSLGSNVRRNLIDNDTFDAIITALNELKQYRVLWKIDFDNDNNELSKHIMVGKWLPQQDILRHANIKLFITQGGLQSLQEALHNHVPLVCLPFFGDQFQNVQRMVKHGVGVKLDRKNLNKANFKEAIIEVATNPKYKEAAVRVGEIIKDTPLSGLQQAVWWTEYVLRHKGTQHLRSPAINMPFYQYYCLDIIAFILCITLLLVTIIYKLFKFILTKSIKLVMKKQKIN